MTPEADSELLLRQYAENQSEAAFAGLVERHINLVFSVALRQVGDPHRAQEITQAVFIILARKAGQLQHDRALSSWLFRTTRLTANNFLRGELRRQRREQEAYMQSTLNEPADEAWPHIAPWLDQAVDKLGETDRRAIVLRFYEGRSLGEVGVALGASEDAAKKRVTRAMEKLRKLFAQRGVTLTAAAIASAVAANSVQAAPVGLAANVMTGVAQGATISTAMTALVEGTMKAMTWLKFKFAAGVITVVMLAGGAATVAVETAKPAHAPDIEGTWMTTLELAGWGVQAGEHAKTRAVFRVTKTNGVYRAVGDSIGQGLKGVVANQFVYEYPSVHIEWSDRNHTFDGKMNPEGTEFSGNWKNGDATGPLTFKQTANPPPVPEPLTVSEFKPRAGSDLQGFWQGFVETREGKFNLEIKIAEPAAGTFRADFYSLNQGAERLPSTLVYEKPKLKLFTMTGNGMFEGELRAGGTELSGTWLQNGRTHPAAFKRADFAGDGLVGVGLELRNDNPAQILRINGVVPNSPAAEAGLAAGWVVQTIDGTPTKEKKLGDIIDLIQGATGTKVRLELVSPDGSKTNTVELTRRKLQLPLPASSPSGDTRP